MKTIFLTLFLVACSFTYGQTWSDDVASIIFNKCAKCHHDQGIAPFSLMSFSQASAMSSSIRDAISNDRMPPYPPDENFQQYSHSRTLSAQEKATVISWVDNNSPEGNAANTPPPPVFNIGSILGNGDLEVKMPNYYSKASNFDDYVCFSIPSGLVQNRKIKALEIIPGNREIVHHCLVFLDETGTYLSDTIGGTCVGPPDGKLLMGYTPGASPLIFPSGSDLKLGMTMTAGSNIVLSMHYPEGSLGQLDSTKVIFHFYPEAETGIREVSVTSVLENWNISLPPNQLKTISAQYPLTGTLPVNFSLLSVFPHMHNLGKEIKAFAIDPQNDTLKFIHIKDWDFHWQDFYFFKNLQKVPAGSVIKGYGIYDNTSNNPNNPNNPPQQVFAGESTADEMFLIYFHYMLYQAGDENFDLESLMTLGLNDFIKKENDQFLIYPNPFEDKITIQAISNSSISLVNLKIYDLLGNSIKTFSSFENKLIWDGKNDSGTSVSPGTYVISYTINGISGHQTIIKK